MKYKRVELQSMCKVEGNEFQFKELSNINRLNISGSMKTVKPCLKDVTQTISRRKLPELHNLQRTVLVLLPAFGIPAVTLTHYAKAPECKPQGGFLTTTYIMPVTKD